MRAKVVLCSVGGGLLLLLVASLLNRIAQPASPSRADSPIAAPPIGAAIAAAADFTPPTKSAGMAEPEDPPVDAVPESNEDAVARRTAELQNLAMTGERESMNGILAELNNKDARIRQAALQAAIQFGSGDAIPALRDAMDQAEDPREKINLQRAIEFLSLPSFSEVADVGIHTTQPQSP